MELKLSTRRSPDATTAWRAGRWGQEDPVAGEQGFWIWLFLFVSNNAHDTTSTVLAPTSSLPQLPHHVTTQDSSFFTARYKDWNIRTKTSILDALDQETQNSNGTLSWRMAWSYGYKGVTYWRSWPRNQWSSLCRVSQTRRPCTGFRLWWRHITPGQSCSGPWCAWLPWGCSSSCSSLWYSSISPIL